MQKTCFGIAFSLVFNTLGYAAVAEKELVNLFLDPKIHECISSTGFKGVTPLIKVEKIENSSLPDTKQTTWEITFSHFFVKPTDGIEKFDSSTLNILVQKVKSRVGVTKHFTCFYIPPVSYLSEFIDKAFTTFQDTGNITLIDEDLLSSITQYEIFPSEIMLGFSEWGNKAGFKVSQYKQVNELNLKETANKLKLSFEEVKWLVNQVVDNPYYFLPGENNDLESRYCGSITIREVVYHKRKLISVSYASDTGEDNYIDLFDLTRKSRAGLILVEYNT